MKLSEILAGLGPIDSAAAAIDIGGVTPDSRAVKPGDLFVAIAGARDDGLRFAEDARKAGAAAIVAERGGPSAGIPIVVVPNARQALSVAAARLHPRQPSTIAAVTGTSGKTSVAAFTRQIWEAAGYAAASIGTIGVVSPKGETYGSLTTPDPVALHRTLDQLAGEGVTHLAMEASSHGLDQHRLDGVRIAAGGFTNLSRDHLDYHPDLESYLRAKLRLFEDLVSADGAAVISADHPEARRVREAASKRGLRVFTVGRDGDDIRLEKSRIDGYAQKLTLQFERRRYELHLPLVGEFQVENALVAAGLAIVTGTPADAVFAALEDLEGAKGRLEFAGQTGGAPVFIDYAHKPDALAKTLDALRPYVKRRLVVVFGCGGNRDQGKRPIMGAIAAEKAEHVIVTDDNPRNENPANIRAEILKAAPGAIEIADRGEAIRTAIAELKTGDVLVIAGKGHESGQIVGDRVLPFSDHDAVAAALGGKTR
ncbi:UDP-N-acetylmuramoyl-L-alanyl-D-glutamate--2,6-diaminopimelate ligase [Pseudorhodoplanes sp.]|uniref:UDP-N-acetylmuramoyl-L-alanyl-D-glutamate--2, 6-diaminopimelate ligase n=1 Tax=Pseudorhodoplanes sp. TaxID=1934341 RepID=UPI002C6237BD|nr:UDP-N-acetylmuramoyl-L-alanyl-D-glutamate--2,6-diaminopimelate ligase [Pseudorhodoplanes sp.]HWV43937.1 UDP-N-acetylmuramoyl-L-alanyl-D-glutamate--2,6-diaminopimelate ligase [Pseudorhodoplanes sp.]